MVRAVDTWYPRLGKKMGGRGTDIETMSIGGRDRVAPNTTTICIVYLDLISDSYTSVRTLMPDIVLAMVTRSTFGWVGNVSCHQRAAWKFNTLYSSFILLAAPYRNAVSESWKELEKFVWYILICPRLYSICTFFELCMCCIQILSKRNINARIQKITNSINLLIHQKR